MAFSRFITRSDTGTSHHDAGRQRIHSTFVPESEFLSRSCSLVNPQRGFASEAPACWLTWPPKKKSFVRMTPIFYCRDIFFFILTYYFQVNLTNETSLNEGKNLTPHVMRT